MAADSKFGPVNLNDEQMDRLTPAEPVQRVSDEQALSSIRWLDEMAEGVSNLRKPRTDNSYGRAAQVIEDARSTIAAQAARIAKLEAERRCAEMKYEPTRAEIEAALSAWKRSLDTSSPDTCPSYVKPNVMRAAIAATEQAEKEAKS